MNAEDIRVKAKVIYKEDSSDQNGWIEGYLIRDMGGAYYVCKTDNDPYKSGAFNSCKSGAFNVIREVKPETVRMFTGQRDKNKKDMYDGDIVSALVDEGGFEESYRKVYAVATVCWDDENGKWVVEEYPDAEHYDLYDYPDMEIIGNDLDNRDLMPYWNMSNDEEEKDLTDDDWTGSNLGGAEG